MLAPAAAATPEATLVAEPAPVSPPSQHATPTPEPAAPPAEPATDFACEDDVRRAIHAKRKIRLTRGAIITPSARDLGDANGIFLREAE